MNIKMGVAKAGIKPSGDYDILVLKFPPSVYSAVFTKNSLAAAPVIYDRLVCSLQDKISAIVVNSGNANAGTRQQGYENAEKMARITAESLGISKEEVLVFSTGVIGVQLPMDKVKDGIETTSSSLQELDLELAAMAISTTDAFYKYYETNGLIEDKVFTVKGIAKGAGMIHPNMATILAYIFTDVKIDKPTLDQIAKLVVDRTFNSISVDGCESTNDSFVIVATGESDVEINDSNKLYFAKKVYEVALELAKMIVKDGEGATKLIEINVHQAFSKDEARKIAESIALSNLFKTAMFGNDPNWGRILAAVGQTHIGIDFSQVKLYLGDFLLYSGQPLEFDKKQASEYLKNNKEIRIDLYLGHGEEEWTYYTCDLGYKYVEINAEYTT